MASQVQNDQEARQLAELVASGQLPPDIRDNVVAGLQEYANEIDSRDNFVRTRLSTEAHVPSVDLATQRIEHLTPSAFANPEDRAKWEANSGDHRSLKAAQRGVDTSSGIDKIIQAKSSLLAFNPDAQALVMEELIRSSLGPEVPSRVPVLGQVEGVPVALQAQEDGGYRYHAIDPMGFDLGNLAEFGGELPQIIPEIAGSIGGAVVGGLVGNVPGAVAGSVTGSGVMGYLGPDARVWVARQFGIDEELIDDAVTSEHRLYSAALAAGGDLVTAGFLGAVRGYVNKSGGKILDEGKVSEIWDDVTDSLKQAGEFKDRTGRELPLTMGALTGDNEIIQAEKIATQQARGQVARDMASDALERDRAVQESLRDMTEQRIRTPSDSVRPIEDVTSDVTTGVRGMAEESRVAAEVAQEELDEFSRVVDDFRSPDTFTRVRDDVYKAADESRRAETELWEQYRKEVRWKRGEGSNIQLHSPAGSPIKKALLEIDEDSASALLDSTRKAQQAFVKDAGLPDAGPTSGIAAEWLDPRELHFALSDLKRRIRHAERGVDPDGFRVADMRKLAGAMQETVEQQPMRYRRAGRVVPEEQQAKVRDAWSLANQQTINTHSLYDAANMKSLLEVNPRTGELAMPQGMIYKRLFQENDARFLSDAMEAVAENPQVKANLAEELVKKHRNATRTDVNGDAHRRFIDAHYDHLKALDINPDQLRGAAGLAQAAKIAKDTADGVAKRLARTFGQRISDETTDAVNIHDELLKLSPEKVGNVMTHLDNVSPKLAAEVRDHSLVNIRRQLASKGDTEINFESLWDILDNNSSQLAKIHGKKYVSDLRLLKKAQQLNERGRLGRVAKGQTVQPTIIDITRSLFGPLSKKQRFISAVQRANRRITASNARKVISSPEELGELIRHGNKTPEEVIRDQLFSDLLQNTLGLDDSVQPTNDAPAGNSVVPGRPSPAEAVGGRRP